MSTKLYSIYEIEKMLEEEKKVFEENKNVYDSHPEEAKEMSVLLEYLQQIIDEHKACEPFF